MNYVAVHFWSADCVLRSGATKNQPQRARTNQRMIFSNVLRLVGGTDTAALRPNGGVCSAAFNHARNNAGWKLVIII
jgi:hypothetical protein